MTKAGPKEQHTTLEMQTQMFGPIKINKKPIMANPSSTMNILPKLYQTNIYPLGNFS